MADETTDAPDAPAEGDEPAGQDAPTAAVEAAPTAAAEPEPDPIDPEIEALFQRFESVLGEGVVEHTESHGTLVVRVRPDVWRRAAEVARTDLDCDFLSFVAGIDWMPAPKAEGDEGGDTSAPVQPDTMTFGAAGSDGRFQVFAHVQSTSRHWGVTLKTDVDEAAPAVDSWVTVYPGADGHERECWEMYGIDFAGHPKIRHLYLPAEFEGHPLRKDFALLAREVKPWPGLVDVEPMPGDDSEEEA
ncbi:MAG: NADH-quinone oxidoreductase subunit C [Acidimicrobiia bacterium]